MGVTLAHVARAVEAFAPLSLAEPWDRPGLQVGDPRAPADTVLVALDPTPQTVAEAVRRRARLVVTHHPLLMKPLERLDGCEPRGSVVVELVRAGIGLYAAHTNLDRAPGGVNDWLAARLGLEDVGPLGAGDPVRKVVVTVPVGYEDSVRRALAAAGAGTIGAYAECSFGCRGEGTFRPGPGTDPWVGAEGRLERVAEVRLETVVPEARKGAVLAALFAAHPYEEPAVDVYALEHPAGPAALGRVGTLAEPRELGPWADEVAGRLAARGVRLAGDPARRIERVAVCGGAGASLWREALARGADVLVTGDVRHHDALDAAAAGLALVDVGHATGERGAVEVLEKIVAGVTGVTAVWTHWEGEPFAWRGRACEG